MKCYRESSCEVRLNGENRCNLRFKLDKCPNSLGDDDDDEMQFPSAGDVLEQKLDGLYIDGEK